MTKLKCKNEKCPNSTNDYERVFHGENPKKGTDDFKCPKCKKIMSEPKSDIEEVETKNVKSNKRK